MLLLSVSGCNLFNSEDNLSNKLVGTWEHEAYVNSETGAKVIYNYHFRDIDTYEVAQAHYDRDDELLGYRFFEEGSYSLRGNKLVMNADQIFYSENEDLYMTIEELKSSGLEEETANKTKYRTEFTNSDFRVTLFFDCPPNALCIEPPVLDKVLSGPDIF
jgi:hypothetical protein